MARRALHYPEQAGADPANPWALAVDESWQAYRTDSAWHAPCWIAEWHRTPVGPAFLSSLLLEGSVRRAVSVVMEPVGHLQAVQDAEAARTQEYAEEQLRERKGFITSWRKRREAESIEQRAAELQEGYAEFRFSGDVIVSLSTHDELTDACARVDDAAQQAGLVLRRLAGEQDTA